MNKILKNFLHRGLVFSGFGPIVLGIVYVILENSIDNFSLSGVQIFIAIVSVYILAFMQAGASVFNQIEEWSVPKSLLCHFSLLYATYTVCYLVNNWIPFNLNFILIFTAIFIIVYFIIWMAVFISIKLISRKLNEKLR